MKVKKQQQLEELIQQTPAVSRQFVYCADEDVEGGEDDPLEEEKNTRVCGLVHKYNH